jgi:hypothetical protein
LTSVLKISDGQQILWTGKKVIDADVASFRANSRFAADKLNLYFDGARTDDNPADNPLDMATLDVRFIADLYRERPRFARPAPEYYQNCRPGVRAGYRD